MKFNKFDGSKALEKQELFLFAIQRNFLILRLSLGRKGGTNGQMRRRQETLNIEKGARSNGKKSMLHQT